MNELALFAGAGGGILGGYLHGWKTVAAVEIEEYPRAVLLQRQADGILPRFPIWDDVRTFDGKPWRGKVDVISGGFPCQDISAAGKGTGITGERSGLWSEMARIIDEVRPRFAFVENSPMLTSRGLGAVLGDLAKMGYNARWCVLGADDAGAPHRRKRIWILGYTSLHGQSSSEKRESTNDRGNYSEARQEQTSKSQGPGTAGIYEDLADTNEQRLQRPDVRKTEHGATERLPAECGKIAWWDIDPADIPDADGSRLQKAGAEQQTAGTINSGTIQEWPTESRVGRVVNGCPARVDRLKSLGNMQVPAVAALAWEVLSKDML